MDAESQTFSHIKEVEPDPTYWGAEIEILRSYLENNLGGIIGSEYSKPQGRIIYTVQ